MASTVRHLMVSKVRGQLTRSRGELALAPDPLASSVTATIELASIDTNNPQRDSDLRSANFFETDTYPTMTFRSPPASATARTASMSMASSPCTG